MSPVPAFTPSARPRLRVTVPDAWSVDMRFLGERLRQREQDPIEPDGRALVQYERRLARLMGVARWRLNPSATATTAPR